MFAPAACVTPGRGPGVGLPKCIPRRPLPPLPPFAALCRRYRPLPPSTALYRPFFPDPVPGEELLTSAPHVRPVPDHPSGPGQAVEDHGPIALGHHPPVEQHHSPHIGPAPDQAPEPLLELQGGVWHQVMRE